MIVRGNVIYYYANSYKIVTMSSMSSALHCGRNCVYEIFLLVLADNIATTDTIKSLKCVSGQYTN